MSEDLCSSNGRGNDPEKKRLLPNAAFAVLQVVVTSATLFLLYRLLLSSHGIEALGVWSTVVAATSLTTVSNLGLAGGTVRFVSKYLAHNDAVSAAQAVETSALSIAVVMGFAAILVWPASEWLLGFIIPPAWSGAAYELVPYTLAALWLNCIGGAIY
jgi:Na+-driven multidrug efflux pump